MAKNMTFDADQMMGNAGTASQHKPLVDDPVVRGAILRSFRQYIQLNWACTPQNLIDGLEAHPDYGK